MWLDHLGQDLRDAVRGVTKYPVAAAVAVVSLAFGIGAMTMTLTVRDVIFRKPPLLYRRPFELSLLLVARPDRGAVYPYDATVPGTLFNTWREGTRGIELGAASAGRLREVRTAERIENVRVRTASANLFTLLGVGVTAGRGFGETGATKPAILSRRVWFAMFGDKPEAIGTPIWIDGSPYTVVGVMPEAFWFAEMNACIWIPIEPARLTEDDHLLVVARRPPGMSHTAWRRRCSRRSTRIWHDCRRPSGSAGSSRAASRERRSAQRCRCSCPTSSPRRWR